MVPWMEGLLDSKGSRPESVTWAAMLGAAAGGATLVGTFFPAVMAMSANGVWFLVAMAALVAVQASAGVLLIVGAARMALGLGRRLFVAGLALEFVTCAAHALNAVTLIASDPDDGGIVGYLLAIAAGFAVVTAGSLVLMLRPSARLFRYGAGRVARTAAG
jgi:hypothetical protein